jgi:hypothetical protein
MRASIMLLILSACMLMSASVFALPPVVNYNVQVMQNATPAQCSNWRGQIGPEDNTTASADTAAGGLQDFGSPGIRTCTGCSVNQSGTCVCKTCYDYTD